ncbi:MAG: sugar phosphate isomerase/epimerase, partial [Clostridia bacterium]|nr:sugar phosphate isomerase/epimerase [Clostridia bacterium]
MANFIFSAFSDEIDSDFDKQILAVKALGIDMIELRGVNGKSFIELTDDEVAEVKEKLDANGI